MKKILFMISVLAAAVSQAEEAYEFVNDVAGYSYIKINQDLASFSFQSDFKSIGNSGKVGFFVYPGDLEGQALKDYIAKVPAEDAIFGKKINHGIVDLGALKAGDRVGFYLDRNNGDLVRAWDFETKHGVTYIAFDKNGGGKDEWMSIGNVTADTDVTVPAGAPLPGALAMLVLGGLGVGGLKMRSRKRNA